MSEIDGTDGVNKRTNWQQPSAPQAPDNAQQAQVLLVDRNGRPLLIKQPRPVGFRKP